MDALNKIVEENGGNAEFERKIREELKEENDPKNPEYINCAIFMTSAGNRLSEIEQATIIDTLKGDAGTEADEVARFADAFREEYFGDDYEACDNAIEIESGYIAFNFDDATDHKSTKKILD